MVVVVVGGDSFIEGLYHSRLVCVCFCVFLRSLEGLKELTHQGPESQSRFTSLWLSLSFLASQIHKSTDYPGNRSHKAGSWLC